MASIITAIGNWEPFIGTTFKTIEQLGPTEAGKYIDDNRAHIASVFNANFHSPAMHKDKLAPSLRAAFYILWSQLPDRCGSFDDKTKVLRILYCVGTQAKAVKELLQKVEIKDLNTDMQNVRLRDAKPSDFGTADRPGPLVIQGVSVASKHFNVPERLIDKARYGRKLLLNSTRKVGYRRLKTDDENDDDDDDTNTVIEGFMCGKFVEPALQKDVVIAEELGGEKLRINKKALQVSEFSVSAIGWDNWHYTIPIVMLQDILEHRKQCALTIGDIAGNIPRKS